MKRCLALCLALLMLPASTLAENRVFYEIFPASFRDSDGDGCGDLNGITEMLDYIADLGAEGIWLMPICPSPTYHKYDVTDYKAIAPEYGTMEDFDRLAAETDARGIRLLVDLVLNHSSSLHPWFLEASRCLANGEESPYTDYYHFSQEAIPGWHTVPGAPGWYYEGGFTYEMPDLNLDNESLRQEILSICKFWIDHGVDGFRLDAVLHYYGEDIAQNVAFLTWLMEHLREMKPDIYVVGEAWKDAGTIAQYYPSGISSLFNFPFSGAEGEIVNAIRSKKGASFAKKAEKWYATVSANGGVDAPFLSNHDNARVAGTLMQKTANLKLAASMMRTLPGNPFIYYGEEIGMTGSGRDENKRLPMIWGENESICLPPANADQTASCQGSVREQLHDPASLLNHYKTLTALRKQYPAIANGTLTALETENNSVCAYRLEYSGETIFVMHNLGRKEATVAFSGSLVAALPCAEGEILLNDGMLTLPAQSTAILK